MNWLSLFGGLVPLLNKATSIWENMQIRKAERTKLKLEQLEEDKRAAKRSKENRAAIDRLSDDGLRERMSKYRRK